MLFLVLSCLALAASGLPSPAVELRSKGEHNLNPHPLDPEPCYGNCTAWNDDSVIRRRSDDKIFRFAVYDGSIYTFTADSWKRKWKFLGGPFLRGGGFVDPVGNQRDFTWTPDVHYINGTYYMFYSDWRQESALHRATGTLSYATSQTMEIDSWTDHGSLNVPPHIVGDKIYSMIDQNVLPSSMYMAFGSDDYGIYGVQLTVNSTGEIQAVQDQAPKELIADEVVRGHTSRNYTQGAFQFQYGNFTYLFFERGLCCGTWRAGDPDYKVVYRIQVCRAPQPTGPYVNYHNQSCLTSPATVFMESHGNIFAPGSVGVHIDPEIGYYIHYQYGKRNVPGGTTLHDNYFGWNYIDFSSGWPKLSATIVRPKDDSGK